MQKTKLYSGLIFIVVGLLIIGWAIFGTSKNETGHINDFPEETIVQKIPAHLEVNDVVFDMTIQKGSSAYDLMEKASKEHEFTFQAEEYEGMGYFISSIQGVQSNAKTNEYWSYYVNDKLSDVAISDYILESDDVITWKYEEIEF